MAKPGSGGPRRGEKKLSWTYRNKKRQARNRQQAEGPSKNVQVQNPKGRICIRNLSFKATEADVRKFYEPFGQIEQIDLLKRPDGTLVGCGFVQFKKVEDASKAIFNTDKKEFLGRPLNSTWAIPKVKYVEQLKKNSVKAENTVDSTIASADNEGTADDDVHQTDKRTATAKKDVDYISIADVEKKKISKIADRKALKILKNKKRARIVVRNLAFQTTVETLRERFEQYGTIEEIKILTRPDGKPVGCGFIQYERVQEAAKATHYENMKTLLGRSIVVDRALPKTKFAKAAAPGNAKPEIEEIEIKEEDAASGDVDDGEKIANGASDHEESASSSDQEDDESVKDEPESGDEKEEKDVKPIESEDTRPRVISHDVSEGKTVFLKNVPFAVTNDELKECMEQFGPVFYALVCMDPLTEHSKGTAFVKFQFVEDAEKCLSAGTDLRLHDQVLDPHRAIDRDSMRDTNGPQKQKSKDSRNLYLVKEGVILAGSSAAAGLSATDMEKRLQMEQWKSQMLRNLNMFVSRVRLVVHNLPPTLDDSQLRQIFKKHAGPKAFIQEARVMRDLKNVDEKGVGKSKEFGFVSFTSHEDALKALRSINNNPNIFSKTKRPIVAFSIENRVMVNAKKRRVMKSRERNPLWNREKTAEKSDEPAHKRAKTSENTPVEDEDQGYSGVKSKPGAYKARSRFNLKSQALLHQKVRKSEKKQAKETRKIQAKKRDLREKKKEVKPKQGAKKASAEDTNFNKLVDNYRSKLQAVPEQKSKWYDT